MNRPIKNGIVHVSTDDVDFYYKVLVKASQDWVSKTGFVITPENISFNLHDKSRGLGLSFTSGCIYLDNALDFYSTVGEQEKEEVQEITNKKEYTYIRNRYTYSITRDNAYNVDKHTVSCEYYDLTGQGKKDTEISILAERINKIINKIKNMICDSLYQVAKTVDKEIKEMEDTIKLKLTEKAHVDHKNAEGNDVYIVKATDEKGNVYIITWLSYENWDTKIDNGEEDDVCDWNTPYSIQLIEKAEEEEEE